MNYMRQIAQMLGVELDEEFYLESVEDGCYFLNDNDDKATFKLSLSGMQVNYGDGFSTTEACLSALLTGEYTIVRKPDKPEKGKAGNDYYFVDVSTEGRTVWIKENGETKVYLEWYVLGMNYMEQVAQMLGVELEEEFKSKDPKNGEIYNIIFKFDNSSLVRRELKPKRVWMPDSGALHQLLIGGFEIVKKPWKPKNGDKYYWVDARKSIETYQFDIFDTWDLISYSCGNCFRTNEEITPEVLEETWKRCYGKYFEEE